LGEKSLKSKITIFAAMELLSEDLTNYLDQHCEPEDELLKHINRETHLKVLMPRMLSGHYQGRLLSMLSKMIRPERILEVGTYTGYATLCLAEGLSENGLIHTIDINSELEDRVRENFSKSKYSQQIQYHIGNALTVIPELNETFDLVFIDADKKNNSTYYNLIFEKVRPGGLIIVDNVLWSGKVLTGNQNKDTREISQFNLMINSDPRVEKLILPVRDGLFMILKK
jgi:caffeoyl-CoA O-methyltransferase